ncbi:MAG: BON domain-containing protein [Chitinophagaceae bacterium]|nr:BON domain-containing protein [Oligoflexus sp.]
MHDASADGTTLSKKQNTKKGAQRDLKTAEVLNQGSETIDELDTTHSEVSRLSSRTKALSVAADNSRINRLQDGDPRLSADQQGNSRNDIAITSKIRRSIIGRSDLSVYVQNVKIITRDGYVVLKGPVRSEAEREIVENTAAEVAGIENVVSGIGVVTGER